MKARSAQDAKCVLVLPAARKLVRDMVFSVTAYQLTTREGVGANGQQIRDVIKRALGTLSKYDALYYYGLVTERRKVKDAYGFSHDKCMTYIKADTGSEAEALINRCRADRLGYRKREGSGDKYDSHRESDLPMLALMLAMHKVLGFGPERTHRTIENVNQQIRYYHQVFDGQPDECIMSIQGKLMSSGFDIKKFMEEIENG